MSTNIKFTKFREHASSPVRGSKCSAGYDLSAATDKVIVIAPHTTVKIPTGISVELPEGTFGGIYARSGIATNQGLRPANAVGIVDSDFRGELIVALHNDSDEYRFVDPGQRIAQFIVQPYINVEFEEANILSDTERGDGGFGSTGK